MINNKKNIPEATLKRLPLYYRTLTQLEESEVKTISSQQFAEFLKIKPEQLRKDLSLCGNFGVKSIGYVIKDLKKNLGKFLGYNYKRNIGIVGAGYLGSILASNENFSKLGFQVVALFDNDERIIGSEVGNVKIYDFAKFKSISQRKMIDIGVIAVPKNSAQKVADILVSAGVRGIWNFAPVKIFLPNNFPAVDVDFSFDLSILNYKITQAEKN